MPADYPVHPVAAIFPMMSDDELDELAADIKANGQQVPIVLGPDGVLIDGRNRLEACRRAGVEPEVQVRADLGDTVAYILSLNIHRRHLSKGQTAMAVAKAFFETKNGREQDVARAAGVSGARVSLAMTVLQYAPERADGVLAGTDFLDAAYRDAQLSKAAVVERERGMARLREEAPDLATQVEERGMAISDAIAQLVRRQEEHRARVRENSRRLSTLVEFGADILSTEPSRASIIALFDPGEAGPADVTPERLRAAGTHLTQLAKEWSNGNPRA